MRRTRILLLCLTVLTSPSASADPGEIESLRTDIATAKDRLAMLVRTEKLTRQIREIEEEAFNLEIELKSVRLHREELSLGIQAARHRQEVFKQAERAKVARNAAVGRKMETLVTLGGRTYRSVKIRGVTDIGISVIHSDGSARIEAKDLPVSMQEEFNFNEDVAKLLRQKELEVEKVRDRRIAALEESKRVVSGPGSGGTQNSRQPKRNEGKSDHPKESVRPRGVLSARVVATGRARIAAKPEDFHTAIFVGITPSEITVEFRQYDKRTYREKFDHLKKLRITAAATVQSSIMVNGSNIASLKPGERRTVYVIAAGRSGYEAKLVAAGGKVLDIETNLRKTGL